jgi:hypothetical protein
MAWKAVTPSFGGDTQHFGGDDGLNKYANLFNGVLDVDTVDINSLWTFRSGKAKIRNPANTFSYILLGAAITSADRNLTLPLVTANDTLAALGVVQTFTVAQGFNSYLDVKGIAVPGSPAATYGRVYIDTADGHLKKKDSAGVVVDFDLTGSGEINTVSNLTGTAGAVGIYKQKTGVNFELKKINAGSAYVTITDDTGNNEVDIGLAVTVAKTNAAQTFTLAQAFDTYEDMKQIAAPASPAATYHRMYVDSVDSHLKRKDSAGGIKDYDLGGSSGGSGGGTTSVVYDSFPATWNVTSGNSYSPNTLWWVDYVGQNPQNGADTGQVGVRVPAGGAFPRVLYMYPYSILNTGASTSAAIAETTTPYYTDFDITLSVRTIAFKRSSPNSWDAPWVMFHFNEAGFAQGSFGSRFHHYYVTLKNNSTIELGKKDTTSGIDEQYFLSTSATYTFALNQWYKLRIRMVGATITIWVDDVQKINLTDNGSGGVQTGAPNTPAAPSSFMTSGRFCLYQEDAEVEFSPMTVTSTGGLVQAYNYLVYKTGTDYTAQNGVSNALEFSSPSLQTVLSQIETAVPTGGYVKFAPGDFSLTAQWVPTQSNIIWAGSGIDVTRILYDMGSTGAGINCAGTVAAANNLTANALKGTKAITIASTAAYAVGDWIFMSRNVAQSTVSATAYDGEFHRVAVVTSGTVLTLDTYLYEDYTTATTSSVAKVTFKQSIMFTDMTIYDNRASVTALAQEGDTVFAYCKDLVIDNVKFENAVYSSLTLNSCFNTDLDTVKYYTPRTTSGASPTRYGLRVIGATTNLTVNSNSAQRCGNAVQLSLATGTGFTGRPRNILITGFKSYDASSTHFLTQQGPVGVTLVNCGAIGSHTSTETGSNGEQMGFGNLSPVTYIGCYTSGAFSNGWAIESDDVATPVGTNQFPQGDRTILSGCRIANVVPDTNPLARGIRIGANRAGVTISDCEFHNINNEVIDIRAGASNIDIHDNIFSSCAGNVSSAGGYIRVLTTASDLNIHDNTFDAGVPSPAARPLWIGTSVARMSFINNDVNGLTNKAPTIPAASTGVRIENNIGLNPLNLITNPFNTSTNTVGFYGGTAAAPLGTTVDMTVVGSDVIINHTTPGTVTQVRIKDGVGNIISTLTGANTALNNLYVPLGYRVAWTFSVAPTITVSAI